jgi:hypothetical protein
MWRQGWGWEWYPSGPDSGSTRVGESDPYSTFAVPSEVEVEVEVEKRFEMSGRWRVRWVILSRLYEVSVPSRAGSGRGEPISK